MNNSFGDFSFIRFNEIILEFVGFLTISIHI
jgi:hypothetical protein